MIWSKDRTWGPRSRQVPHPFTKLIGLIHQVGWDSLIKLIGLIHQVGWEPLGEVLPQAEWPWLVGFRFYIAVETRRRETGLILSSNCLFLTCHWAVILGQRTELKVATECVLDFYCRYETCDIMLICKTTTQWKPTVTTYNDP